MHLAGIVKNEAVKQNFKLETELAEEKFRLRQIKIINTIESPQYISSELFHSHLENITHFLCELSEIHKKFNKSNIDDSKSEKSKSEKSLTLLSFFMNNKDRVESFLNYLIDNKFIDTSKTYTGRKPYEFALVFKALVDLRDKDGNMIVKHNTTKELCEMLVTEIIDLKNPYPTFKKSLSPTDERRINIESQEYIDTKESLIKFLR